MKNLLLITILSLSALMANAQNKDERKLNDFDRLSVGQSIDVIIEYGNENKAVVETSGVDVEDVITEVNGGKLTIEMERGSYRMIDVKVYLTYKKLNNIKVSSSASLKGESILKSSDLRIKVSSSARVNLEVETGDLQVAVSSSGRLTLYGSVNRQTIDVSSSGRYSAYDLKSKIVEADISSSGRAEVYVTEALMANASSSGRVSYKGDPNKVIADNSSSGKVRKAE
jgi:hypothetical protein